MRDTESLREFYLASHRRLVVSLATTVGSVPEAEDCVQEAFARIVPRWDRISTYEDPEAWIRHVATNIARSRWRRSRRAIADRFNPPERDSSSDTALELLDALKRLPAETRETLALYYLVDLPIAEVAIRLGVPLGTVKARLSRGRRMLALQLSLDDEVIEDA